MLNSIKSLVDNGYEVIFTPWLHKGEEFGVMIRKDNMCTTRVISYLDLKNSRLDPEALMAEILGELKNSYKYDMKRSMGHDKT